MKLKSKLLFLTELVYAGLIYHQEIPDRWPPSKHSALRDACVVGNCSSSLHSSFYNFDEVQGSQHCFRFNWADGSQFSWCQDMNPIEIQGVNIEISNVYYTPASGASELYENFESGSHLRFSGLSKSPDNVRANIFDGTAGFVLEDKNMDNTFYGVAVTHLIQGAYKSVQVRSKPRPGEKAFSTTIDLYYQKTPFAPHGLSCFYDGTSRSIAREILFSEPGFNPVYKCEGGAWGSWEPWSECSLTCESGHKTRTRVCSDLVNCEGPMFENVVCNTRWCPVPFELQGTCTCDPLSFSCDQSTTPNLPCEIDEKCEKFSMVSAESFRCVKKNQGTCKSVGDPHVSTYDFVQNDVYGVGKYVLTQSTDKIQDVPDFKVVVETYTDGGWSSTLAIEFTFTDSGIDYLYKADKNMAASLTVDGVETELISQKTDVFEFEKKAKQLFFKARIGVDIHQNHGSATVKVASVYKNHVEGICGNYNDDISDDFTLQSGEILECSAAETNGFKVADCEGAISCDWLIVGDCSFKQNVDCDKIAECELLFNEIWLQPCHDLVDRYQHIQTCAADLCQTQNVIEAKREMLAEYIGQCAEHGEQDAVCNWIEHAGFGNGCGENQIYDGCAKPCADAKTCELKSCPADEVSSGMCLCADGYRLQAGVCVLEFECINQTGLWSEWHAWATCSVTCGEGVQTRSRFCIGPGPCRDISRAAVGEPYTESLSCVKSECPIKRVIPEIVCFEDCGNKGGKCDECVSTDSSKTGFCCSSSISKASLNGDCTQNMINTVGEHFPGSALHHCVFEEVDEFLSWSDWSDCSVSCGDGVISRTRICDGDNCAGNHEETIVCNTHLCKIPMEEFSDCTCPNGSWGCASDACDKNERCERASYAHALYKCVPKVLGQCKAWGDPHMISFDQQLIDVYGVGMYVFTTSETIPQVLPFFKVLIDTTAAGQFSVVKDTFISFYSFDGSSLFEILYTHDRGFIRMNNGIQYPLQTQSNDQFTFHRHSQYMTLKTWFGMTVYRDGHTLTVTIPTVFQGHVRGLCGDYNMGKCDDWTHSDGLKPNCKCENQNTIWTQCEKDLADSWQTEMYSPGASPGDIVSPAEAVIERCTDLFTAPYLQTCQSLIDHTAYIKSCYADYMTNPAESTLRDIVATFVAECKKRLPNDEELTCSWMHHSGFEPNCEENQVWNGCAKSCSHQKSCWEYLGGSSCEVNEETKGMCVCQTGYYEHGGKCILAENCELATGKFSEWSDWSTCSVTCGEGTKSKTRICLGPGWCNAEKLTYLVNDCDAGTCAPLGENCAVLYENQIGWLEKGQHLITGAGQISNLAQTKVDGKSFSNRVSSVKISQNCELIGYQKPNFEGWLGKWRGSKDGDNFHEMNLSYENDKMSSFKCSCEEKSCIEHWTYGEPNMPGECPAPKCGEVTYDVCDAWKKKRNKTWKYGNVMKINIPPKYWRQEGWSLILRFNGAHKNSGTFQVWNAQFFNIYRKPDGLEIHLQMKWWTADIDDQHSFTIVSDHLNLGDKPELYFWNTRRPQDNTCFPQNSRSLGDTDFNRMVEMDPNLKSADDVNYISISKNGKVRLKNKA